MKKYLIIIMQIFIMITLYATDLDNELIEALKYNDIKLAKKLM